MRRDGQAGHRKHGTRSDLQDRPGPVPCAVSSCFIPASSRSGSGRPALRAPPLRGHDPLVLVERSLIAPAVYEFFGQTRVLALQFRMCTEENSVDTIAASSILRERDAGRAPLPSLVASARLLSGLPSPQSPPPHAYLFSSSTASLASPPAGPSPSAHSPWARSEPRCRVRATG